MQLPIDLQVDLPTGWSERDADAPPREFRAGPDGSEGTLQVSELDRDHYEMAAGSNDLGTFAAMIGSELTAVGQNWGAPGPTTHGTCKMGRFGAATFTGGEFPTMLIFVTVSPSSGFLWTWLGPVGAGQVQNAFQIVLGAEHGGRT
jgi:hypothetical protein